MDTIGYIRVSTSEQGESGLGLEDQRQRIITEAQRRGWALQLIEDSGYSAKDLDRPGITTALTLLRNGEAHTLVVSKLDRLSRSLMDFAGLMERAAREGWNLVALDLGIDLSTPSGALMANVLASFAEYERRLIGQRTRDALAVLRAQGRRLGRLLALSPSVRAAVAGWRAAGCSLAGIAQHLNEEGVPTAHGGNCWHPSTVRGVLRSIELDGLTPLPPCRYDDPHFEIVEEG